LDNKPKSNSHLKLGQNIWPTLYYTEIGSTAAKAICLTCRQCDVEKTQVEISIGGRFVCACVSYVRLRVSCPELFKNDNSSNTYVYACCCNSFSLWNHLKRAHPDLYQSTEHCKQLIERKEKISKNQDISVVFSRNATSIHDTPSATSSAPLAMKTASVTTQVTPFFGHSEVFFKLSTHL
jgi:hypothetical protein